MPKSVMPIFEPKPYYMTAIGMQGARFIEGNDGAGGGEGKPEAKPADKTEGGEGEQGKPKDGGDGFKSPESKDAVLADLQKERDQRKVFQGQVAERDTQVQTLTESLTEKTNAVTERDATITAKDSELAVLRLAVKNGLSEQADIDLLSAVTDEAKRTALAERLAKQAGGSGVVRKSGTSSGEGITGGSIAEHRRQIAERKQK